MEEFLKTKKGLEYLLETSPSYMLVVDAITEYNKYIKKKVSFKLKNGIRRR